MTLSELQETKDFAGLFNDSRFRNAIIYLRQNFPNRNTANGDEWRGYYMALSELEGLAPKPPKPDPVKRPERLYPDPPMKFHPENNQPAA